MDETSLLLGWLVGRMVAGQRGPGRPTTEPEIVAFFEDGVLHIVKAPAELNENILEVCKNV